MQITPYLFFEGRCEEALEFYRTAIDAKLDMLMRFQESPDPETRSRITPGTEEKVMHASFHVGNTLMYASDGMCQGAASFQGFSLSLEAADRATAEQRFAALAEGGSVQMPLMQTFWSPAFGMVTDKFGVSWMVTVPMPIETK